MTPAVQVLPPTASVPAGVIASTKPATFASGGQLLGEIAEGEFSQVEQLFPGLQFRATTTAANENRLKQKFESLAAKWREETEFLSSVSDMVLNKHYQQIIGQGVAMVPYILEDLKKKGPDHWYWALSAMTEVDPAADAPEGDIKAICEVWLDWGRKRGIVD